MVKNFLFIFCLLLAGITVAQVPQTLSYQGLLTDATGSPLSGNHTVMFNFYTVSTAGTVSFARGPLSVTAFQGLFTVILGNGQGSNNAGLPNLGSAQYYIGIVADGGTELAPRVALTAVPYAFTASALDANTVLPGTQVGTGINASNITTGTLPAAQIGAGSIDNTKLAASGISASKITTGTLSGALLNAVDASKITTGTLSNSVLPVTIGFNANKVGGTQVSATTEATLSSFTTTLYNVGSGFNATTGVFTAPLDGWYSFTGAVTFIDATLTASVMYGNFVHTQAANGNTQYYNILWGGKGGSISGSCITYMKANDTMKIMVYQNSGSAQTFVNSSNNQTYFCGVRTGN